MYKFSLYKFQYITAQTDYKNQEHDHIKDAKSINRQILWSRTWGTV